MCLLTDAQCIQSFKNFNNYRLQVKSLAMTIVLNGAKAIQWTTTKD